MIKESYFTKIKTLPEDAIKVEVGYPSVFAPSDDLLTDFNELRLELMKAGKTELEARRRAWGQTNFEKRYRKRIMSNPMLIQKLKEIKKLSEKKDVYLYCYCGKTLCPRFILMDIIRRM
jgi:hypothetical protein